MNNVGKYIFDEDPVCNYPETVTLKNLPSFITHNESTSDFTLPQNNDISLIGSYLVTIRSEISIPTDYTQSDFSTISAEYEFTIFIEPCQVSVYSASQQVAPISYSIGATDLLKVGAYGFDQDPVCGYAETVTLTNLPAFVTHNAPTTADFSVPQTSDLSLIGSYTVTIRSTICVPDDHTQITCTPIYAEQDLLVQIEPCKVSAFEATTMVTVLQYNVNQATLTDGFYAFDQDPACNYPETITVVDLPPFVTHNELSSDFTIPQNNDLNLIGEYTVTLRSEIQVPDDHTQTSFTPFFVEYEFYILVEACIVDSYTADDKIEVISYNIGDPRLTSPKYSFIEDPACLYPETVSLIDLPSFVAHNEGASDFTIEQISDLSLIGSYAVTLRSEIQIPDDFTQTTFTTKFVEYELLILIEPCLVNTYSAAQKVTTIIYNIGAPSLTDGSYFFDEDPACNYPETVTLTNLPSFVEHNTQSSDFTIAKNDDLNIIGAYTVTIRSEIQKPDDHLKTTFTSLFAEYDFEIHIQACIITAYELQDAIPNLEYTIGDPGFESTSYLFRETPECSYPESVTLTDLPFFLQHQQKQKNILIAQTDDLSLDGSYTVTLRSEIQVPDDHTLASYTTWAQEFSFTIVVIDPCKASSLGDFAVEDMSRSVKQTPNSQALVKPTDTVSLNYGSQDGYAYCGRRVFEITTQPSSIYSNFLSLDQSRSTLTYGTNQQSDAGIYELEMRVYLLDYPNVEIRKKFQVEIVVCQVIDLVPTPLPP